MKAKNNTKTVYTANQGRKTFHIPEKIMETRLGTADFQFWQKDPTVRGTFTTKNG